MRQLRILSGRNPPEGNVSGDMNERFAIEPYFRSFSHTCPSQISPPISLDGRSTVQAN